MKTKRLSSLLLYAMFVWAFSCSKEGPQGPAGPQGEQGIQGETGPRGTRGEKGDRGTANVIYSDWLAVKFYPSRDGYGASIKAPELTQAILDKGNMELYMKYTVLDTKVYYKFNIDATGYKASFGQIKVGNIPIVSNFNGYAPTFTFRYIIIPGGVHARRSAPLPDFNDYHAVCTYYGIPE